MGEAGLLPMLPRIDEMYHETRCDCMRSQFAGCGVRWRPDDVPNDSQYVFVL